MQFLVYLGKEEEEKRRIDTIPTGDPFNTYLQLSYVCIPLITVCFLGDRLFVAVSFTFLVYSGARTILLKL